MTTKSKAPRARAPRRRTPPTAAPVAAPRDYVRELVGILARLRAPDGCPWDHEQTHTTLKQYLVEESAEVLDAIDEADDQHLAEELGDLLLQIVFHCQIAREDGRFDLQEAARLCCEKMVRRHPHVFGTSEAKDAAAVLRQWETIKKDEKTGGATGTPPQSVIAGVPKHLPALHRAHKVQRKAAKVGFDWPDVDGVLAKIEEELAEVRQAIAEGTESKVREEIGDLLFAVVNLSRFRNHVAEEVLHETVRKFETRFQAMERLLAADGKAPDACGIDELERYWQQAKRSTAG